MISNIKPELLPAYVAGGELVLEVLLTLSLFELKSYPSNHGLIDRGGLGTETEEITKELEVWLNAEKSFVEMNEDRDMDDGIGI